MCSCVEIIRNTKVVKANKDHKDSCREFVLCMLDELRRNECGKLTFKEWRLIAESIRDKWVIKKGQLHEVQINKMDGEIYTFRNKIGLASLCHKYELFPDC